MGVELKKLVEKMNLKNLTPDVDMTKREIKVPDINRPALQLAGFFDHFDSESQNAHTLCRTQHTLYYTDSCNFVLAHTSSGPGLCCCIRSNQRSVADSNSHTCGHLQL